ncbi:uncharacterized protein LOC111327064 isoform X2 [Stylophora pistillata]|uniref:uncharacterized protein LOC111327064 isoform X2 n=1 Tax=Stylophora pistillata TaxID=50429 RepID=UPI000C057C8B|nr:uncharacterized protein LOC111327064 isoform X2 [Stylophora pistillata]
MVSTIASTAATSKNKTSSPPFSIMKYQYPPVFKDFIIHLVQSLNSSSRAAFKFYCKGLIPDSMLDGNMATDVEFFALIESLQRSNHLSFTNMSLLKEILSSIGRRDLLQDLKKVKLRISIGFILEDYLKFKYVDGMKPAKNHTDIVDLLLTTEVENCDLITQVLLQFNSLCSDRNFLKKFTDVARLDSQLSWPMVTSSLVIIGELYASFTLHSKSFEEGSYVYWFSNTKASELLSDWIFVNGGLIQTGPKENTASML